MLQIIHCLRSSKVVREFVIQTFEVFDRGFFLKVKVILANNTELFIREYVDSEERNYYYHWKDSLGNLIMRWDNAFHHKHLSTHPHHVHVNNQVLPSCKITCNEILEEIEKSILED